MNVRRRRFRASRRGWSLLETVIAIVVVVILISLVTFVAFKGLERVRRLRCSANMQNIGRALEMYHQTNRAYPIGSRSQTNPDSIWGPTWWLDIIPYLELNDPQYAKDWKRQWVNVPRSGDFQNNTENPNYKMVDGLDLSPLNCPSSELPQFNNPEKHVSAVNRKGLGRTPVGIPVPTYVAISGSAPDMKGVAPGQSVPVAYGRTTKDGKYGVLSASGVFPPNRAIPQAIIQQRDGLPHTIMVAEQSDYGRDTSYDPPVLYDLRSAWVAGAFTGAGGNYGDLSPTAEGINGSGAERCYNITTVRYPINTRMLQPGIVAENVTEFPPPKEGEKPREKPKQLMPGPGHNQGIFSAHPGGANVLYCDSRVEFHADDMDVVVLQLLITRDDGQPIPAH